MWEPYSSRREHHGVQLYGALKIDRGDAAARLNQYKRNYEFFNAPVALFIAIDRRLGPGQWADLGGYIHALMYLARGYGLDTCAQESWARLHGLVGPFVNMPPEQMLFCAVSIGYGDRAHPANSFRAPRAAPEDKKQKTSGQGGPTSRKRRRDGGRPTCRQCDLSSAGI